jgi:hypothetical protein
MGYDTLLTQFKLLGQIIKQPTDNRSKEMLRDLNTVIFEKIPETFTKGAPPEYYELYTNLKSLYAQFRNFLLYDRLIGKSVVALGGGFSTGKSSFMNALNGERALPTDISPSTAVPTFVINCEKHEAFVTNKFDAKVPIGLRDIALISHGFGEIKNEDGEVMDVEVIPLGHVLKSVFLASPKQTYKNLAFVDTPGYSKPDAD